MTPSSWPVRVCEVKNVKIHAVRTAPRASPANDATDPSWRSGAIHRRWGPDHHHPTIPTGAKVEPKQKQVISIGLSYFSSCRGEKEKHF